MQGLEIKLCEKHIRDANEELAEKVKALETAKKNIAVKEGVLTHKKDELEKIIADTEIEEKELRAKSDEARSHIDERLLYSYDRIRNSYRNGLAVVVVERDACGGCFNAIPPQRQSEIRLHKKIIVCENCGRILVEDKEA
jgi:predicted  nucleic acid-binding Zn-ribbon protein